MDFTDVSLVGLRVVREIAERGTFSAAATALGYTQSAVSRQVAAVERAAGMELFERRHDGAVPTPACRLVLRRAAVVLDEIDAADRELRGLPVSTGTVRLGAFPSAGAVLLPTALSDLRRTHPGITVHTRDGGTPALVRALRAGTLDLAVLASAPPFRPPDNDSPALVVRVLAERNLCVAVSTAHPLASDEVVTVTDLRGQRWITGRPDGDGTPLGVWPGLAERPEIHHVARDWQARLGLVAADCGITTVPALLVPALPPGVRALRVVGEPEERRRLVIAHLPHTLSDATTRVTEALRAAAARLGGDRD
ncbi:LysR family transcriptional regulator [Actinokineospora enzanensis]|uniref:LysR family transcriptional regulator n=1 Tax=Actinokineospora enzanensis TaxID=155975 RepID=UPI00047578FE|nr:LysR family transcriptional regulator [Actinokineospora enzanensis]